MNNEQRDAMIRETHEIVVAMAATCKLCQSQIKQHEATINGTNGTAGHKARLATAETTIAEVSRSLDDAWRELTWMRRSIIVGLCVLLLSIVGGVLGVVLPRGM